MKTFKFSFLSIFCTWVLLLVSVSCEKDESQDSITPSTENIEIQTSEYEALLRAIVSYDETKPTTPISKSGGIESSEIPISFDVTFTVSEFDFSTFSTGRTLRTIDGTFEVEPVDEIPFIIFNPGPGDQLFAGTFTFVNNNGRTRTRRVAAVEQENGNTFVLFDNVPRAGGVFIEALFLLEGDFSEENILTRNQRGEIVVVDVSAVLIDDGDTELTTW
ncbi:MAG: hypothetical protein AAGD17_07035 [Bacteroidota bacterium]